MSIYDKASLVLIPSGTKTSKVYSQKPTNGDGDFTFSRSTAATRVNASGNIEKETNNYLLQSNQFDTTWTLYEASLTSGHSGYDGSSNAWKLIASTTTIYHEVKQSLSVSGVQTFSVYAKAGGYNYVLVYANGLAGGQFFNLSNGTKASTLGSAIISSSITDAGGGWYRCSITFNATNSGCVIQTSATGSGNVHTGDGTSGVFIQDAQLEQGLVARDVITTTTTAIYGGITDNVPRLDYQGSCPALLLEPQRTNSITQSEYFDAWNGFRMNLTPNDSNSPEGLQNAYAIAPNTDNNTHFIYFNITESAVTYNFSLFAKADGLQWIQLAKGGGGYANFDLTNGVVGNYGTDGSSAFTNASIEEYENGWYRINAEYTSVGGASNIGIAAINSDITSRYQSFAGDGTNGYLIYGATLEAGSYATSYIPTYGSAVTRNVDTNRITSATDLIGQTEGTLFAEFEIGEDNAHFFLYTNTSNAIYIQTKIGDMWRAYVISGGVYQVAITTGSVPSSGFVKMAFAYKENDFVLYANGNLIASDTSGSVPACNSYDFGLGPYGAGFSGKRTKQTMLFKTRLSNEELAALTTI